MLVETSLKVKLQVSMCYEHTLFTIKDSLTLPKFWLSLLWQSGEELTWAFGDIDEEQFSDACDQFDIKQILPLAAPVLRTVSNAYHVLKGVTQRLSTGTLETQLVDWLHSYEGQGFLQLVMQLWSDTPQTEGVVDAIIIRLEEILGAWSFGARTKVRVDKSPIKIKSRTFVLWLRKLKMCYLS